MAWGDNWGHSPGRNARQLAAAYQDARTLSLSGARVVADGGDVAYYYKACSIARRFTDETYAGRIAVHLTYGGRMPAQETFAWNYGDEGEIRHLRALGIDAERRDRIVTFFNKQVLPARFYSREQLAEMPDYVPSPKPPRRPRFVNLTMELFA